MPILAQRLQHRPPSLAEGFCGLERGLYATDCTAPRVVGRRSPPHHGSPTALRPAAALPLPPPPQATGHVQGVPEPILEDVRTAIPVYATYRIIEDPRA